MSSTRNDQDVRNPIMRALSLFLCGIALAGCAGEGDEFSLGNREARGDELKCTRTIGYWKTHNVYATHRSLQDPWPISEDSVGCGDTWLNWLNAEPEGDAWIILAHQWIGASLNWGAGVEMPADIEDAIAWGGYYLTACEISDEDREAALEIAATLDAYNNGLAGVPQCE